MAFIVEIKTTSGPLSESFETYEAAKHRVDSFPDHSLVGMPMIYQELPDGSQRLVREDLKPLQVHRLKEDFSPDLDEPVPLVDPSDQGAVHSQFGVPDDEPLPLADLLESSNPSEPRIRVVWTKEEEEDE